ncbi:hypothetical protein [Lacticaseibacillus mingshuiensis]|uniref:hypothetical protein n=1 Tax=Lacticaseibacillus mingshuiensis TaxID=2799574 RepID=UPI001942985B|nr:hypothetical protein [Lacticaseibacillus mingshuiensis]
MPKKRWEDEQLGGPMPRPWWLPADEIFNWDRKVGNSKEATFLKISSLTREQFIELQNKKWIPADYKIDDWIKSDDTQSNGQGFYL